MRLFKNRAIEILRRPVGERILHKCEAPHPVRGGALRSQPAANRGRTEGRNRRPGHAIYACSDPQTTPYRAEQFSVSEDFFEIGLLRFGVGHMMKARRGSSPERLTEDADRFAACSVNRLLAKSARHGENLKAESAVIRFQHRPVSCWRSPMTCRSKSPHHGRRSERDISIE